MVELEQGSSHAGSQELLAETMPAAGPVSPVSHVEHSVIDSSSNPAAPRPAGADPASAAVAKALALKRAMSLLTGIRYAVPGYASLQSNCRAALSELTPDSCDISGAESEPELESPFPVAAQAPVPPDSTDPAPPSAQESVGSAVAANHRLDAASIERYRVQAEEEKMVLAVGSVNAFLSVIGGFSIERKEKVWRKRKIKKEAPPPTPAEEARLSRVHKVADTIVRKLHDKLWVRYGQASEEQKEALAKNCRRGLRNVLPAGEDVAAEIKTTRLLNATTQKLVEYLSGLGDDWDSMIAASHLGPKNVHEWTDMDWLQPASAHDHGQGAGHPHSENEDSGSGESVWEEVDEDGDDPESKARIKYLTRIRLLKRLVTAHITGKLQKLVTAFRAANPPKKAPHGSSPTKGKPTPAPVTKERVKKDANGGTDV